MRDPYQIIRTPRITEKATNVAANQNTYVFEVSRDATKQEIKYAVEQIFKKNVVRVNTVRTVGKSRRTRLGQSVQRPGMKKAYVKLKDGEKIEFV